MEKILQKITDLVHTYESGTWQSSENLRIMLRELTTNYYHLTKYNIEAFKEHNSSQYHSNLGVTAAKVEADEKVPELRMMRKIMEATEHVMWSMKSELSIIKKES